MAANCARCGGATRPDAARGPSVQVCSECGAVSRGAASSRAEREEPELSFRPNGAFDGDEDRPRARRGPSGPLLGVALLGAVSILGGAVALGVAVFSGVSGYVAASRVADAPPAARAAVVAPVSDPEPPPEPSTAPDPEVAPEPAPAPAPPPPSDVVRVAPPAPKANSGKGLVKEGWSLASRDPVAASTRFEAALAVSPSDPEAHYGLGYCLNKLGNPSAANPHLCLALTDGNPDVVRDVRALLERSALTCP